MACQRDIVLCLTAAAAAAALLCVTTCQSADTPKSAFGEAFDEIVVESTLTVRGKGGLTRQSRNKDIALQSISTSTSTTTTEGSTSNGTKRSKRGIPELYGPRVFARPSDRIFQVADLFGRNLASPGGLLEDSRP